MRKRLVILFILALPVWFAANSRAETDATRTLRLGMTVSGQLDGEDRYEDIYLLRTFLPRGIYNLFLTGQYGEPPSVTFSPHSGGEDISIDAVRQFPVRVCLSSGQYSVSVYNDREQPRLPYTLRLDTAGSWDESMEWEPNGEEPNQTLVPNQSLIGQIIGDDEDLYSFSVSPAETEAYDFSLKTERDNPLILKISDGNENEERCRLGAKMEQGHLIKGLSLDPGTYVVSVALNPMSLMSFFQSGDPSEISLPVCSYTLDISINPKALCTLVREDEAYMALFADAPETAASGETEKAATERTELAEMNRTHRIRISTGKPLMNLSKIRESHPSWADQMTSDAIKTVLDVATPLVRDICRNPFLLGGLRSRVRLFGIMPDEQAAALSSLWPHWDNIPEEWSDPVIFGPAAKRLQSFVFGSAWIISATLVTSEGWVSASSTIPDRLWIGSHPLFKRWKQTAPEIQLDTPVYNETIQRWVQKAAFPLWDGKRISGVLIMEWVIAR